MVGCVWMGVVPAKVLIFLCVFVGECSGFVGQQEAEQLHQNYQQQQQPQQRPQKQQQHINLPLVSSKSAFSSSRL